MIPNVLAWNIRGLTLENRLAETRCVGPGFDEVRLAAAITVLLHHAHGSIYDAKADILFAFSGGFLHFGLLAVLVFFSISGFLVAPGLARSGKVIDYAVSRALRIFPALVVVVILTMILLGPILTTRSLPRYFSDSGLLLYAKNILTLTDDFLPGVQLPDGHPAIVNGALWTLHFEVLSYVALAVMSVVGILARPRLVLVVFLAAYIVYVANGIFPAFAERLPGRFVTFISLFVYFASGVVLSTFRRTIPYSAALAGSAFLVLLASLAYGAGIVAAPLCLPYLVVFAGLSNLPGRSFVRRDLSYGVYLIHAAVLCCLSIMYPGIHSWELVALMALIVTLFLSYASSLLVEQPALSTKKSVANWIGRALRRRPDLDPPMAGGAMQAITEHIALDEMASPVRSAGQGRGDWSREVTS
ncbi:acyltransferase [Mesorhizobium sp. CU2]|uniref:acyltransferase family protein n=1 Tax=unclassified Mesorhizobium TaxID=325217 RepID=UPI001129CD98|nr:MULTISPECIES: acyltransferase [unclassified Mesorhizobium]TPN85049.1 acyltransferase [Mesorhizobium sp. CU3]TPO13008.1 acyltransferase [Mesorhizobium sp. CU2]